MKKPRRPTRIGRKRRAAGWTLLALGVLVAGAWVWSARGTVIHYNHQGGIAVRNGVLLVGHRWGDSVSLSLAIANGESVPPQPQLPSNWQWWCWNHRVFNTTTGCGSLELMVSLWPIPLLLWTPAALLLRSGILARRRAMTGTCTKCGYSLAGIAEGVPCPECGKAREAESKAKKAI